MSGRALRAAGAALAVVALTGAATGVVALQHGASGPSAPSSSTPSAQPSRAVLRVGAAMLGTGLVLPPGVRLAGPATTGEDPGDYHRWQVALDLGGSAPDAVLGDLETQLRATGFDVQRYDGELLGARSADGRAQLVVAHVGTGTSGPQIVLAIGSRPA